MSKPYTLSVYNTLTGKYENVPVTEKIYRDYKRTGWNIEDNDASFYDHEIQFSQLIGGDEGAYENFHEFVSDAGATSNAAMDSIYKNLLRKSMKFLEPDEAKLITALFFGEKTERQYANETGIPPMTIHDRKIRILKKIKKFMDSEK
jgi:DNA-directed RNA polymerase specialized sigma subunit